MLAPPELFGIVEEDIYRCTEIDPLNLPFLETLSLTTILSISPQPPARAVCAFAREHGIAVTHMVLSPWRMADEEWKLLPDRVVQDCLAYVLNTASYPLLIIDMSCTFIGVLRKLQRWNLSSIINEYREMSFDRSQYLYELYIEMVDLDRFAIPRLQFDRFEDYDGHDDTAGSEAGSGARSGARYGRVPRQFPIESLPRWYITQERMWMEDKLKIKCNSY